MQDLGISDAVAHPLAYYRNHLEFNGYQVEEDDDTILGRHARKANLIIRQILGRGVLVSTIYGVEPETKRIHLLEYVNDLNTVFLFMKAYLGQDNDLFLETFLEGDYDRTNFSILLENIEYDIATFYKNEMTKEYLQ
ncbi:DNA mismatch repair protein [Phormidium sp. FACHB-592]|uniref:YbjN domain-containing protein n=1 Tax=Stenomitos frigidus AS-A4 TaxID=2933935 RepID=A0ABV0KJD9_9CYAN|nr:YbjN domain-containing protein [Phormidium sp. FACHB-592]MBD2074809.1 DNA mismatch repair protein [Phormidium sp. FACHB-592]